MAMRPRTIGGARNSTGTKNYEDFKPKSEWMQDQECHTLLIHLPGFTKESLKVSTQGTNILRVGGVRLVTANKWKRFQEDFQVPDNCNLRGTHARFEGGILDIRVPKETITPPPPNQESKPTEQAPSSSTSQKTQEFPKDSVAQKAQDPIPPNEEHIAKPFQESPVSPNPISPVAPKPMSHDDQASSKQEKVPELLGSEHAATRAKDMEGGNKVAKPELVDRIKQDSERIVAQKTEFVDHENKATGSGTGHLGLGNYKKVAKTIASLDEERKLLVNMGAAVLVFISLGAYIYHTVNDKI